MKIIGEFPPNIEQIRYYLDPPKWAIFAYGDTIYAPSHKNLYPDIIHHEEVHEQQMKLFRNPGEWWDKYLTDTGFRLSQELEAYSAQYLWLKGKVSAKDLKEALTEMSIALSLWYNIPISTSQAETKIRLFTCPVR